MFDAAAIGSAYGEGNTADGAPPALFLTLSEALRCAWDFGFLAASLPLLWTEAPGDGHPVIVLPGFLLDDHSTWWLRSYLTGLGYQVHGFSLGQNCGARTVGHCGERLTGMIDRLVGNEPVSLVGHSLGGVLAREFARQQPARVRRVITLGSPYAGDERSMPRAVVRLRRALTLEAVREEADLSRLPVPHTIVYSESDGMVSPVDCRHPDAAADNVDVRGSHLGLVFNPMAFRVIAERLRRPHATAIPTIEPRPERGAPEETPGLRLVS